MKKTITKQIQKSNLKDLKIDSRIRSENSSSDEEEESDQEFENQNFKIKGVLIRKKLIEKPPVPKPTNPKPIENSPVSKPTNPKPIENSPVSKPTNTKPIENSSINTKSISSKEKESWIYFLFIFVIVCISIYFIFSSFKNQRLKATGWPLSDEMVEIIQSKLSECDLKNESSQMLLNLLDDHQGKKPLPLLFFGQGRSAKSIECVLEILKEEIFGGHRFLEFNQSSELLEKQMVDALRTSKFELLVINGDVVPAKDLQFLLTALDDTTPYIGKDKIPTHQLLTILVFGLVPPSAPRDTLKSFLKKLEWPDRIIQRISPYPISFSL